MTTTAGYHYFPRTIQHQFLILTDIAGGALFQQCTWMDQPGGHETRWELVEHATCDKHDAEYGDCSCKFDPAPLRKANNLTENDAPVTTLAAITRGDVPGRVKGQRALPKLTPHYLNNTTTRSTR